MKLTRIKTYIKQNALSVTAISLVLLLTSAQIVKELYGTALNINGKRVTGITDVASVSPLDNLITDFRLQQALTGLSLGSGNKMEVFNVRDYGAVPDVVVPGSGSTVTGTNNQTAFQACYNATPRGGIMFIPPGNWLVNGGLGTWTTKDVVLIQLGNVYTNGTSYITIGGPGGADRVWSLLILGKIIGRVNIPTNSPTTRGNGTSPQWPTYTGTAITLQPNVNNAHIKVKWIEGMGKAVEIQGGGGGGSQENTIACERYWYNAVAVSLRNTDGLGWTDKNHFVGWDNGCSRITGGLAVKIDGYPGAAATNGEIYNGAARSNVFRFLAERLDSLVWANGDITYNTFDITKEAGTSTGIFSATPIQCRKVAPNIVRNNKWTGEGIVNTTWLTQGLGIDDEIEQMVYLNNAILVGFRGKSDGAGVITMQVKPSFSKANRDALAAINIKCTNELVAESTRTITSSTGSNTSADAEGTIKLNNASMNFTATSASTNVGVSFKLININASTATITGVTGLTSLAQNKGVVVTCDGTSFIAVTN